MEGSAIRQITERLQSNGERLNVLLREKAERSEEEMRGHISESIMCQSQLTETVGEIAAKDGKRIEKIISRLDKHDRDIEELQKDRDEPEAIMAERSVDISLEDEGEEKTEAEPVKQEVEHLRMEWIIIVLLLSIVIQFVLNL